MPPVYVIITICLVICHFLILFGVAKKQELVFSKQFAAAFGGVIGRLITVFLSVFFVYSAGLSLPVLDGIFSQWTFWQAFCASYIVYVFIPKKGSN